MKRCSAEGCQGKHYAKGLCGKHYQRMASTGHLDIQPRKSYDRRGEKNPKWRGGKSSHPLYQIYHDAKRRCESPNHARYADYGGRGIRMHPSWVEDFWAFVRDVGPRPDNRTTEGGRAYWQLDRIDNDGNYEPGNVRWASPLQQRLNARPKKRVSRCRRGHDMDGPNVVWYSNGSQRRCRECSRINEYNRARSRERRGEL